MSLELRFLYAGLDDLRAKIDCITAQASHLEDIVMEVNPAAWRSIMRDVRNMWGQTIIVATPDGYQSKDIEDVYALTLWDVWITKGQPGDITHPGLVCLLRTCERSQPVRSAQCERS